MYTVSEFNTLQDLPIANQRVFLRADLNIPLHNKKIEDDFRLRALLPTIDYIHNHEGSIVLATHIGRPHNKEPDLSTTVLVPWFEKQGYSIVYEPDLAQAQKKQNRNTKTIVLLENLRFFPGEKSADQQFAQQLADCADLYVDDAFAVIHRHDSSITLVPNLFAANKKAIGLLIEKELTHLNKLLLQPQEPFVLILGGGKVSDKLPLIESILEYANIILLCPAIVYTFLAAQKKPVGRSLVDTDALERTQMIVKKAKEKNVKLVFPVDYQVALNTIDGPLTYVKAKNFPAHGIGTSIGPETVKFFCKDIAQAGTIFYNAGIGFDYRKETLEAGKQLLHAVATSSAYSVVGGGSSVALVRASDLQDKISFLSSGGGATLTYLASKPLPGLEALINRAKT